MMQKRMLLPLIVILSGVMLFPAVKRGTEVFPVTPGGALILENINGSVELSTHKRHEIRVDLEKMAPTQKELDEVDVRMKLEDNGLRVEVKRLRRDTRAWVNFRVIVPERLQSVSLTSVNGAVRASGDLKELSLESVNGALRQQGELTEGRFRTVNGAIVAVVARSLAGGINARSVNGSIQLEIPRTSDFEVSGDTLNGAVRSDFELKVERRLVGKSVQGVVGKGDHAVKVKTVNGSIKILAI
ncbi:MAG: DUF4097 family beta strand repeat-containing protein [Acidobacteriota bacterium]|jgi:DUF4097 and DUF4098 domain-containing protein YvlB|nr:DUF4097 family beta strand repeat-containing protein [Acidobacteriota bacterium]